MFPTEVSSVDPTFEIHIFLNNMESIRIIRRKDIWKIRRGGQSNTIIFIGNGDGRWEQIWGISGSFMRARSTINGDGKHMQIWTTIIICKGIIESVINRPIVALQC